MPNTFLTTANSFSQKLYLSFRVPSPPASRKIGATPPYPRTEKGETAPKNSTTF